MKVTNNAMWLRGFADGEGHVSKPQSEGLRKSSRVISIPNTEPILIKKACEVLDEVGITYFVRTKQMVNRKPIEVIFISHQENLIRWRDKVGFTSLKKTKRLASLIKEYKQGHHLWTEKKKEYIKSLFDEGWNQQQISNLTSISTASLSRAVHEFGLRKVVISEPTN
ncbi:hypothetical protein LCGC14_0615100 [marine sediment metagenome]|uniref:Homing endonuclease LAGLIDADG domain-containing protein n=1 Tax=marine sediment metagenome TaxID=412755 RepID=A0A0F9R6F6_9ZZZZ|nr:hypothetical protein [bacterium]